MKILEKYFVPISEINTTDTDGDGLYDVYENVGMRLSNGQYIYSDPQKKDTDGDGLNDGEEVFPVSQIYDFPLSAYSLLSVENDEYDNLPRIIANEPESDIMLMALSTDYTNSSGLFGQTSNPNLKDTDKDLVIDSVDYDKNQYNVNDEFFFYFDRLEKQTNAYCQKNGNKNQIELICMFIRNYADGTNNKSNYINKNWIATAGKINDDYIDYVKQNDKDTYNYFGSHREIYSGKYFSAENGESKDSGLIDLYHLFATLNALCHNSGIEDAKDYFLINKDESFLGAIKMGAATTLMPDTIIDELAGWAGDLQSIMRDVIVNNKERDNTIEVRRVAMKYVISNGDFSKFPLSDLYTDYDAVNLYYKVYYGQSKNNTITEKVRKYYSIDYTNRFRSYLYNTYITDESKFYDYLYDDAYPYMLLKFQILGIGLNTWPLYNNPDAPVTYITSVETDVVAKVYAEKVMELYYKEKK
jgi:hypothetical protein